MALGSANARNAVLDSSLSGASAPANLYLALFTDNTFATEITGGGYARVTVAKASWAAASGGTKANGTTLTFPTSTGAWTGTASHAALMSTASGAGDRWDSGALGSSVSVPSSGVTVSFAVGALIVSEA